MEDLDSLNMDEVDLDEFDGVGVEGFYNQEEDDCESCKL